MATLSGRLLVAAPMLTDPHFSRTVVLMLDHTRAGALGVVLNRPSGLAVDEVLPSWSASITGEPVVFEGGPVETTSALALATVASTTTPIGWRSVDGHLGLVDLDAPVEVLREHLTAMRVFAGYAGWSSTQLEAELEEGAWFVVTARDSDVFSSEPASLWRAVLRRQTGRTALFSTYVEDASLN